MSARLTAPYTADGQLMHTVPPDPSDVYWLDNHPFDATLQLVSTERGSSAAYFVWNVVSDEPYSPNLPGREFPMFMSDAADLIRQGLATRRGGAVRARWQVVKRGSNYGIQAIGFADVEGGDN